MEILIPAFLVLHIFGIVLWTGSVLVPYVYLSDIVENNALEARQFAMEVIGRLNRSFLNIGLSLVLLTGIGMIFFHGTDWFLPRIFVHVKITVAIIAAGFSHVGWSKFKKANALMEKNPFESSDEAAFQSLVRSWKLFSVMTITLLGITVIAAVFKFGS